MFSDDEDDVLAVIVVFVGMAAFGMGMCVAMREELFTVDVAIDVTVEVTGLLLIVD